jgi:SAM-dependent methyltransferase
MTATAAASGSARRNGELWGARARDWALNEEQQVPTYEEAIRRAGIAAGQTVLEVGCGTGVFLRAAADCGALVNGLDASEALLAIARERVPEADLREGDMQCLPYDDDRFDVVAGFNSFFFAADIVAALREAKRVAKPGAPVVVQVWGRPDHCDLTAMKDAFASFMPPPDGPPPPELWRSGTLEGTASDAGLTPSETFDLTWAYEFPDADTLARAMLSPGLVTVAIRRAGEEPVRTAIVDALAGFRTADGRYRLSNEWHFVIAAA